MKSTNCMDYRINLTMKDGSKRSLHGIGTWADILEVAIFIKKNWEITKIRIKKERTNERN